MTLQTICDKVMQRLNLTSDEAQSRIKDEVNEVYREFVSSMGMETSVRGTSTAVSVADSRYVTFGGTGESDDKIIKLLSVFLPDDIAPPPLGVLNSCTFDELRNTIPGTWPPRLYAVSKMGTSSVEVFLDADGDGVSELNADCLMLADEMVDDDSPFFPTNFHDILVYGVMAIELDKMEKEDRRVRAQERFEQRCSELRMFIAKDAYMAIHQGKTLGGGFGPLLITA